MFLKSLLVLGLLFGGFAHANLVQTDWYVTGDHRAYVDDTTGIEWLNLNETMGQSINGVQSQLTTTFAGWRFATYAEAIALVNNNAANGLNQLSMTINGVNADSSYGLHDNNQGAYGMSGMYLYGFYGRGGVPYGWFDANYTRADFGVYLVSDGGTTLSSILNPSINALNANAPINNAPAAVSAPLFLTISNFFMAILFMVRRKKNKLSS